MGQQLTDGQRQELINVVTAEEIRAALFDIGSDKAPGPDGYGAKFFTSAWDTVGPDVQRAVQEFFVTGRLLRQWNHTLIALVPKSDHSPQVRDYRPISCCTVIYKVISKILASRMAKVMDRLLDPAQAALVRDRSIAENIHLAQELLRKYARKRISPRCVLKVDLQKAFDTVDWGFLQAALVGYGFPQQFRQWITECVTTVSFSIGINGGIHGFFQGRRGLRQATLPPTFWAMS